jgi:transposase
LSSKVRFGPNLLITIPARGFWKRRIMKASQKFALDHTLIGSKASCTTGGNHRSDYTGAAALLGSLPAAEWLLADRGYDANWFREALKDKGIKPCIPGRKSRGKPIKHDKRRYRRRNRIEIMFGRLKDWRRVATRYDRCPKVFLSAVALAATVMFWL